MNTFELRDNLRYYNQRFSEMPVGDPMSGACYGEYLKSKAIGAIIGVVAAVAAVWTGGATLAAYAAAGSTVSIGSAIAAGAMVAGGVMSGVGAVTGNKKLMKIGGVLALAGGLGSMAASAFSGTSTVAGEAANAAPVAADGSAAGASEQLVGKIGQAAEGTGAFTASAGIDAGALEVGNIGSGNLPNLGSGLQEAGGIVSQAGSSAPSMTNIPTSSTGVLADAAAAQTQSAVNASPMTGEGGFLEKAGGWMNENKTLVEMGGKLLSNLGGQALNGGNASGAGGGTGSTEANDAYLASKTNETNASAEALRAKAAAEEQQRKNANTQVEMISASDPNRDAKVASAVTRGVPYQIMFQPAAAPVTMGGQNYATTSNQWAPQR